MAEISTNTLFTGDNLYILNGMNSDSIDLIYLDPPFNSKRFYSAPVGSKAAGASFKDMWSWQDVDDAYLERMITEYPFLVQFINSVEAMHSKAMMAYLTYMTQRIIEMHRVLKSAGSIYLHCDSTASHYLKIILDRVFGKENFRNEIVWCYKENDNATKHFPKKHDVIFFYSKSAAYTFNIQRGEITEAQKKRYNHIINGERYANMKGKMRKLEGGAKVRDWWEIPIAQSGERVGYPTQKPLALLYRIIEASSSEDDVVFDPFCGCATTCVAAQQLGRKWIGIDIEAQSAQVLVDRLSDDAGLFADFVHRKDTPKRTDVKVEKETDANVKKRLSDAQGGKCNGCGDELDIRHFHTDHIVPKSKGGGDYCENYQLLCGNCNSVKGDRPMEYLRAKIRKRDDALKHRISFGE